MKRVRALASVLACLAVLASGVMTVAAAAPFGAAGSERHMSGAPCKNCHDCDGMPCPMPAASCVLAALSATPALAVATFELPAIAFSIVHWSPRVLTLSGLSPPPDPFPPRA